MAINYRNIARNASIALIAQGITMLVSVVTTLVVPKVLGIEQYGYWQLFLFYTSYVGFFHLGLNDGVYLVNGGVSRNKIDKSAIKSQFLIGTLFQFAVGTLALVVLLLSGFGSERQYIFICTVIYMVVKNAALYLGYVFQAINETKLYSISCISERCAFVIPLAFLLLKGVAHFEGYVLVLLTSSLVQLVYCCWKARDFLRAPVLGLCDSLARCVTSVRAGIKLMFANIASMLILGFARFVIDGVWGIEAFGKLSLALSLVNFFLAFVTQVSMVLFPELRRVDEVEIKVFYKKIKVVSSRFLPILYVLYFPLSSLMGMWLPDYAASLQYLVYLLPICVFDANMNLTSATIFKVLRQEDKLFRINVLSAGLSIVFATVGAYIFKSVDFVIFGATISIIWRSVYSDKVILNEFSTDDESRLSTKLLLLTGMFMFSSKYLSHMLAMALSFISYCFFVISSGIRTGRSGTH